MKKLLMVTILVVLFCCSVSAQTKTLRDNQKLQYERSYEYWKITQKKTRIKAVKYAVNQSKDVKGYNSRVSRLKRKEERIRKNIIK
jgi:uncharacterized protein YcfL